MSRTRELLLLVGAIAVTTVLLVATGALLVLAGVPFGLPLLLLVSFFYGWMLFVYFSYRRGRQEEFLNLLITAAESGTPLAPALRAYLEDRPHGPARDFWAASLFFFVLPGYYWLWYRQRNFDRKVEAVADQLEQGVSLHYALQLTPGVASREMVLAAGIGEATGKLALCLKAAARPRLAMLSLELVPRLVYPLIVLVVVLSIFSFWMVYLHPKMQRIFLDFGSKVPDVTARLADIWDYFLIGTAVGFVWLAGMTLLLTFSSTIRWFTPGFGWLYRMHARSRVLKMLGILLSAEMPAPQALAVLADSGYFEWEVERRLEGSRRLIEQGEPLAKSLYRRGLLTAAMAPLVDAAERARNLPWALAELGDHLAGRTAQMIERITKAIFPLVICGLGLVVGFMVVGMFLPMIEVIGKLGQ